MFVFCVMHNLNDCGLRFFLFEKSAEHGKEVIMAKTETTDIWRQQGGYLVFVDKDGFVRRCIRQSDREAKVLTLRVPIKRETFRQRMWLGKEVDFLRDDEDYSGRR